MKSLFPDICCDNLPKAKRFYMDLLGFTELVDIGWYVQLCSPLDENTQIAFVKRSHDSVPADYQATPKGVVITVEVEDADEIYKKATSSNITLVKEITSEVWGQRHFMACDPNGLLLDVYHMIEPDANFLKEYGLTKFSS